MQKSFAGYTLVEIMLVIFVIGLLLAAVINATQSSQARARDSERATDLDNIHSKLEEYFSDNGGYPNTLSGTILKGIGAQPEILKDPAGNTITIVSPVANQVTAMAVANPTDTGAQYKYIPYPTSCGLITCTGYVLKSYIEKPSSVVPNPYIRLGLNNN